MVGMRYFPCGLHVILLLVLLFMLHDESVAAAAISQSLLALNKTQQDTMRGLWRLLNSESIMIEWNIKAGSNPCLWEGVTCSPCSSGSFLVVTDLVLSNYDISNSSIFAPICRLDTLLTLDLPRNSLSDLSSQLFASSSCSMKEGLQSLNLSRNWFSNSLSDLSGFHQLQVLDLSFNYFVSGNLSTDLSTFSQLTSLNLSYNNFQGHVPIRMPLSLEDLVLSRNGFSDGIPEGLIEYRNLTKLDLSLNNLTGHVLDNFAKLVKLQTLILSGNRLSGSIPESLFSNVKSLSRFAANQNNFAGLIPSGITRHLKMLDLSFNNLSGKIPPDLLSSPVLEAIDLTSNRLVGEIPPNFSPNLYRLRLGDNFLNGSIPESIGNASKLAYLEVDHNELSGVIPHQLGKCKDLSLLNLAANKLQGRVPDEISSLEKLVVLRLQVNNLSGSIPITLSSLPALSILNLSQNSFIGEILPSIVQMTNLTNLDLEGNKISGIIPTSISLLTSLIELNLGNNALYGTIPQMPISLSTCLNLSHNSLSGSIPSSFGLLKDLEIIDLSYNSLAGTVPSSLVNLQSLTQLVLSYNQLSGFVPSLPPHVLVNTTGNPGLANSNGTDVNQNFDSGRSKRISAIIGALVGLFFAAVIAMFISCCCKRIYGVEDEKSSVDEGAAQINNGCLTTVNSVNTSAIDITIAQRDDWQITPFQALDFEDMSITQGLIKENLIGRGGAGHVYRVTYINKYNSSTCAVAVKQIQSAGRFDKRLEREFDSEVRMLGNVRHKNIVKLQCCIFGTMTKLLMYDYMENGSLDHWLHGHALFVRHSMVTAWSMWYSPLDWPTRLRVAVGAAQGLCYMHHECLPPIIHRDVKTSNILLDSEFQAKVADFGLSRMLVQEGQPDTMSAIAGSFGYMAPEYAYTKKVNEKVDVYSFGVVLLELTSGKKANDGGEHGCLAQWAWHHYRSGESIADASDKRIRYTWYPREIETVFRLGVQCTDNLPSSRPTMKDVLRILLQCSKLTDQKTREERATEHEASLLFLPKRGSRQRWFTNIKGIIEEKSDFRCIA